MKTVVPLPAFEDNYIWVVKNGKHAVVVDAGDGRLAADFFRENGLTPLAALCTHHHDDHSGGNRILHEIFSIPVYGPRSAPGVTHPVREGDEFSAGDFSFSVIDLPGHTLEHAAFLGEGWLFCGDALFGCGCGRIFEGTAPMMHDSLSKIARLPFDTLVYPAHEYTIANLAFAKAVEADNPDIAAREIAEREKRQKNLPTLPSTVGLELATNPFLRAGVAAVKRAAENHAGRILANETEVFAELRQWRNVFKAVP